MTTTQKAASAITVPQTVSLEGFIGLHLPAFKRKRIEEWCLDVAQYLKAGSLCRSVIGHVMEDNRLSPTVTSPMPKSAPAATDVQRRACSVSGSTVTITINAGAGNSTAVTVGTLTDSLCAGNKRDGVTSLRNKVANADTATPTPGRDTPIPDASGPLPVARFSYSHYSEQRRRIDRLVQGLPVLSAPCINSGSGTLDRLNPGCTPTVASGVVIYVNGEEPAHLPSRERKSRSPATAAAPTTIAPGGHRCNSHCSSNEPRQLPRGAPVGPAGAKNRNASQSSVSGSRSLLKNTTNGNSGVSHYHSSTKITSSEIVVIEDDFHQHHNLSGQHHNHNGQGPQYGSSDFKSVGFRSLNFDLPSPNKKPPSQKVAKARKRVLAGARRAREHNSITPTHVPIQSCWAMAELTW